ncbi:MAG: MFS transporter, partial [Pseudomonadota bacterium]
AAASGGLVFINGLGAVFGPLIVGALMETVGPSGFYMFTGVLFAALVGYAAYRATQRAAVPADETGAYVAMSQATTTPVAMELAQEYAIEADLESEDDNRAA